MIKLRKESECAIHLLKYLSKNKDKKVSLKEVAENTDISFLFLQKIARKLKKDDLIKAEQGVNGGYVINVDDKKLSLLKILKVMEDDCLLLSCLNGNNKNCKHYQKCSTRITLGKLNKNIIKLLEGIKLKDL